jgi:ABC-type microcin C transport system duplicated ATPase subunit YejF
VFDEREWPIIECESLGPGLPSNNKLARFWDRVALTEEEDLSLKALRLTGNGIDRVAVVGEEKPGNSRRVVVKLRDHPRPVPLKSLGDGVTRLFAAALALANSRDGFLIVDEAENGIHYSVQRDFWRLIMRAAHQHNVQVLATTHSSDCVRGFARAAAEINAEGVYVRLERDGDQVRAVGYTEEELETVAEQGIEVR